MEYGKLRCNIETLLNERGISKNQICNHCLQTRYEYCRYNAEKRHYFR